MLKKKTVERIADIDFEFNKVVEPKLNLVSCVVIDRHTKERKKFWLHKDADSKKKLVKHLQQYQTFFAWSVVAEARSFIALGLDPLDFEWIDGFLEYRMLTNHNDRLQWGKQLVDGRVKFVVKPKPKWQREEGEEGMGFRPTHSLAEATYKLTGRIRDTAHKNKIRDLIISSPKDFSPDERKWILDYNEDDVVDLPDIQKALEKEVFSLLPDITREDYIKEAKLRGRYAAHTAWMENIGYPINVQATKNFSKQVDNILYDLQREINHLFPDIKPFKWQRAKNKFSWNQKITKEWIEENHDIDRWKRTKGGGLSLALEAWERFYDYKHDYPEDKFGAQMVRFLKLKQSLYGFAESTGVKKASDRKSFWDYVGSDGRVRPYLNIYQAQSSRSQPAAKGFMFLKPAWMRALVQPIKGRFVAGIDYGAQEFFAAAIMASDTNMMEAYLSGDPYLALAKLVGAVPPEATKDSHKSVRNQFKTIVLGISYLMSKYGLAIKLTADTGRVWDEDEAQEQIDLFYSDDAFWKLKDFQEEILLNYADKGHVRLPCGWYMFGDNENHRSVTNVPIQGLGASVMRKAVDLARARGVTVIFTLHDALYIEDEIGKEWKIAVLRDCMREAFAFYFPKNMQDMARKIRLDPFAWSPNYKPDSVMHVGKSKMEVPCSNIYIDERAGSEYEKFSRYFEDRAEDEL